MGLLRLARQGSLARLAMVYLPFRMFRSTVHNTVRKSEQHEEQLVAIDAMTGTLDLYQFAALPSDGETTIVHTTNTPTQRLLLPELEAKLGDKLRRTIFRRGFYALRDFRLELTPLDEIYVPYWVAFRGRGEVAHLEVLDAVRRSPEGDKVRRLIEQWIAEA